MGRQLQFTSIDRVISKIYRDTGIEELPEQDVIEWIGEALEAISTVSVYEEAVAFITIKNHRGDLPTGLHSIIQVAKNNKWSPEDSKDNCGVTPAEVILDCPCKDKKTECGCGNKSPLKGYQPLVLDCHGGIIGDYELAYYRPYFDLQYEYHGWMNSSYYRQQYTPMRLSNHTFFNSLVCEEDPGIYTNTNSHDEYTINGDQILTSFKEGSIAIAYYRTLLDPETGYPMVPDDYSALQAIHYYVTWKYMSRMWYLGREGFGDKMQEAERQWIWYCNQFGNSQMMIYGIDQHENLKDLRHQLVPSKSKYYGYFGKLSKPQNNSFKDPNGRNNRFGRLIN